MVKRKGLGRGLGALIPDNSQEETKKETNQKVNKNTKTKATTKKEDSLKESSDKVVLVAVKDIKANTDNPRKTFDEEGIKSLAESIKLYGILQPLVLLKKEDHYEIVAGERRFRAASSINLKEVPAIIKDLNDKDKDMISMVENIQREDLNPYEEAQAYNNIMKQYGLTQAELSQVLGKSRTYIANIVRLLSLDDFTITELEKGTITSSQGRALLGIKDIFERKKYLDLLIRNEITVNEIEKKSSKKKAPARRDLFVQDLEDRLRESLGTKVNVLKKKNKWTVNIEFTSDDQIEDFLSHYDLGE